MIFINKLLAKEAESYRQSLDVTEKFLYSNGYTYPICPRCKITFEREYQAYCDRCGQKLGWRKYKYAKIITSK